MELAAIHECGKCSAEFSSSKELDAHIEENHQAVTKKVMGHTPCYHLTTIPCFDGLDHMNVEEAAGWFVDECVLCGHKTKPYLVKYSTDKIEKQENGGLGQWLKQT